MVNVVVADRRSVNTARISRGGRGSRGSKTQRQPPFLPLLKNSLPQPRNSKTYAVLGGV
ncbi:MAG: hypothetical protein V7L23_10250 [Nostoc sp.]